MTDDERDDLLHAVLDGYASRAEVDRVEADPALRERLAELSVARDATAAVPPPPPGLLDGQIASALDAFDVGATGDADDAMDDAQVVSLDRRRRARLQLLQRAAAVVIGLVAVGALLTLTQGGDDDATSADTAAGRTELDSAESSGDDATVDADDGGGAAADAPVATENEDFDEGAGDDTADALDGGDESPAPTTTAAPDNAEEPFAVATVEELRDLLRPLLDEPGPDGGASFECLDEENEVRERGTVRRAGQADVADRPVRYLVIDDESGPVLFVIEVETCSVRDPLPF